MKAKIKKPFKKRLWWKITAIIIGIILLFFMFCWLLPRSKVMEDNPMMKKEGERPLLIAHGGGNQEFPDNVLESFYNAYSVDRNVMMETDVSITKDNIVILSHDTTLSQKTNCNEYIIEIDYTMLIDEEIDFNYNNPTTGSNSKWPDSVDVNNLTKYKNYKGEEVLPTDINYQPAIDDGLINEGDMPRHTTKFLATTLEDLLRAFPNNKINVEIKQKDNEGLKCLDAVIELIEKLEAEGIPAYNRVVLASFHSVITEKLIEYKNNKYPEIMCSPGTSGVVKFFVLQALGLDIMYNDPMAVLQIPMEQMGIKLSGKALIKRAHRHNIAIHYWTINDPDDMELLCKNGADGIMSDRPTLLKEVYDRLYSAIQPY